MDNINRWRISFVGSRVRLIGFLILVFGIGIYYWSSLSSESVQKADIVTKTESFAVAQESDIVSGVEKSDSVANIDLTEDVSNVQPYQTILNDLRKLDSNVLVLNKEQGLKTSYATYLIDNDYSYRWPFGEEGGGVLAPQHLVVVDLDTGKRKIFNVFDKLVDSDLITFVNNIPPEVTYNFRASLLRVVGNILWGKIEVFSMADPAVNSKVGYFTIDLDTNTIESYVLPDKGLLASVKLDVNKGRVLYESLANGLTLYVYDLRTGEDVTIVHYPPSIFDKYCSHFIEYIYNDTDFYGDCGIKYGLDPMWSVRGDVRYTDFVTRKQVLLSNVKGEQL